MKKYVTEFIGTFFLVFIIGLCVVQGVGMAPLAIGAGLMILVYMGGHISGAHYNPAVTLGVIMRGSIASKEVVPYIVAQILGAIAASLAVNGILGQTFTPAPGSGISAGAAIGIEILFTFLLVLVILNVATSKSTEGNDYYGLAIGFTLVVAAFAGGAISGGAFNPAVGIGPIVVDVMMGNGTFGNLWLYLVGPVVGGALAAVVFKFQEK